MDRYQYKNKIIKIGAAAGAACIFLIVLLSLLFLKPMHNRIRDIRLQLNENRRQFSELNSVTQSIIEYRRKKLEAEEITGEFLNYLVFADDGEEGVSGKASVLFREAGIEIDKIIIGTNTAAGAGYTKQFKEVNFNAGFQRIVDFVKNVEFSRKYLGVENFVIESSGERGHDVNMTFYSVAEINPEGLDVDDVMSGSLIRLPETTLETVENLIQISEYVHVETELPKDPLYYGDTLFKRKAEVITERRTVAAPPRMVLGGIMWDETNPVAVINGDIKREGDRIRDAEVTKISRDHVLVKWRTQYIRLRTD